MFLSQGVDFCFRRSSPDEITVGKLAPVFDTVGRYALTLEL